MERVTRWIGLAALVASLVVVGGIGCDREGASEAPESEAEAPDEGSGAASSGESEPTASEEGAEEASDEEREAPAGDPFPEVSARTLEGETVELQPSGEATLVNLWATWCAPCIAEFPEFQALREAWGEQGLRLVGLSIEGEEAADRIAEFVEEHEMPFDRVVYAPDRDPLEVFGGGAVPASFLYDADGNLVWWYGSMVEEPQIRKLESSLEMLVGSGAH